MRLELSVEVLALGRAVSAVAFEVDPQVFVAHRAQRSALSEPCGKAVNGWRLQDARQPTRW